MVASVQGLGVERDERGGEGPFAEEFAEEVGDGEGDDERARRRRPRRSNWAETLSRAMPSTRLRSVRKLISFAWATNDLAGLVAGAEEAGAVAKEDIRAPI